MNLGLWLEKDDFFGGTKREVVKEETELQDIVFQVSIGTSWKVSVFEFDFEGGFNSLLYKKLVPFLLDLWQGLDRKEDKENG